MVQKYIHNIQFLSCEVLLSGFVIEVISAVFGISTLMNLVPTGIKGLLVSLFLSGDAISKVTYIIGVFMFLEF